ncbi:unnamed protein product [Calypogeia fissa]
MGSEQGTRLNDSLYELYCPQVGIPSMQVVFFHGFQRKRYDDAHMSTWLSEDESCIWPKTWLKDKFPHARILSVSYNGGMLLNRESGQVDLHIVVENLISDLRAAKVGQESNCPVVLVGHSFGGLVIKRLCVDASNQASQFKKESDTSSMLRNFLDNLKGFFFYATPNVGVPKVDPELLTAKSPLMEYVKTLSNPTSRFNHEFDNLKGDKWRVAGLGESVPSKWGKFEGLVVPEASARCQNFTTAVGADHISISRPRSTKDRRFYALTDLLDSVEYDSNNNGRPENLQHLPSLVVGIVQVLDDMRLKLDESSTLGFFGMGGIGKTTLAMALFNALVYKYDFTCFLTDVKKIGDTVTSIEEAVLENTHYRGKRIVDKGRGLKMTGKTFLLVLDDVSSNRHLDVVQILRNKFGMHKDSRFLATSRNQHLLKLYFDEVHEVSILSTERSRDLFLSCAPNGRSPPFESYVDDIVEKCGGLPLALQVVGSYLKTESEESSWKPILKALEETADVGDLDKNLWAILRISYNGLSKEKRDMFLDATTVFYKWPLSTALAAWNISMKGLAAMMWQDLVDLCLVWEIRDGNRIDIGMHEQLLNLGRKIGSSPNENGCRIWNNFEEAFKVLSSDKHSVHDVKDIVALKVCTTDSHKTNISAGLASAPENYITVWGSKLCEMINLRYLWLEGLNIDQAHEFFSCLFWLRRRVRRSGRIVLPSTIVCLELSSMDSDFPFDPSEHRCIAILSLRNIHRLRTLPATFGQLASLQSLTLEGMNSLRSLPDSLEPLKMLQHLIIERCPALRKLPNNLGKLVALETLRIGLCDSLSELPNSLGGLSSLKDIRITRCSHLDKLPETFVGLEALEHIELNETSLQCVPDLGTMKALKSLQLSWAHPSEFPWLPECLREQVTKRNYTFPLKFSVVNGILQADRPGNFQHLPSEVVGIGQVLLEVETRLKSNSSLGLVGMVGIGKTTMAKALFNDLSPAFEYSCFVTDVKGSDAVLEDMYRRGKKIPKKEWEKDLGFLKGKRLLLVLDGVTVEGDLRIISHIHSNANEESRFIVTSRDLALCQKVVDQVIPVPFLDPESSKQLLFALAGPGLSDGHDHDDVDAIVRKCEGLPLSIRVVGQYLRTESEKLHVVPKDVRQQAVLALDNRGPKYIQDFDQTLWAKLRHSYDCLDQVEQNMFLDAATVFDKTDLSTAKAVWSIITKGQQDIKWQRLVDRCLVREVHDEDKTEIGMQAQLRSLGRRIASTRGENERRLWNDTAEAFELLSADKYREDVVKDIIALKCCRPEFRRVQNEGESGFAEHSGARGSGSAPARSISLQGIPLSKMIKLQYLWWEGFDIGQAQDSTRIPSTLLYLDLSNTNCSDIPFNPSDHSRLAVLRLRNIHGLHTLPASLGQLKSLQILALDRIHSLSSLPASLEHLAKLKHLSIERCPTFRELPSSLGCLVALETLRIGFCFCLSALPESLGLLGALKVLEITHCGLESLPASLGRLVALEMLRIGPCNSLSALPESLGMLGALKVLEIEWCSLESLPTSLGRLVALETLRIRYCSSLSALPESLGLLGALKVLEIQSCGLKSLPASLGRLVALETLRIGPCDSLSALPQSLGMLGALKVLDIESCGLKSLPTSLGRLVALETLRIRYCSSLSALPESLGLLGALKVLEIESCGLKSLPASLGRLVALEMLRIGPCDSLSALPESLGMLGALKVLEIELCGLKSLPASLGWLVALEMLRIRHCCSLSALPESLQLLGALKVLEIEECGLKSLPASVGRLVALETLRIRYCYSLSALP